MKENTVIVSDLHFDYWNKNIGSDYQGQTKRLMFEEFVDYIKDTTSRFVINGDPLDIPGAKGSSLEPDQTSLLKPLKKLFLSGTEIIYVVGNHDIGIAGLKIDEGPSNVFSGIQIKYPFLLFESGGKTYYLEHGDYHEPFALDTVLALFKYAWNSVFNRGGPKDLMKITARVRQRRSIKKGVPIKQKPGVINKPRSFIDKLFRHYSYEINEYKKINWRDAARDKLRSIEKEQNTKISGIIFGHTHLPDEEEMSLEPGRNVYFNSGSWASDLPCAAYLVVMPDGSLKRRCFWEKKRGQDLNNDTCDLRKCAKDLFSR